MHRQVTMVWEIMNSDALPATEQLSCEQALAYLPEVKQRATAVLRRLRRIVSLPERPRVVDVGSAQGNFLAACADLGCEVVGIEPYAPARATAAEVAKRVAAQVTILEGTAESLPLESNAYDVVHANSVIEHVDDANAAFREAHRVLKSGGVFWFSAASSVCPRQSEIRRFPGFGWYPDPLKQRIMHWAALERPDLIAHTARPAIHWFTPWKARRMLREAGFSTIYDRWDLRLPDEGGARYALALRLVRANFVTKLAADVLVPDCSYAAIKP
jgi:SAM-dependent methyltransferase